MTFPKFFIYSIITQLIEDNDYTMKCLTANEWLNHFADLIYIFIEFYIVLKKFSLKLHKIHLRDNFVRFLIRTILNLQNNPPVVIPKYNTEFDI